MNMNDAWAEDRVRRKSLFLVEGYEEYRKFLPLIWRAFPELRINEDVVIVYETNIYILYAELVSEYSDEIFDEANEIDVDLPYLVSKNKGLDTRLYKSDFSDIFLIFDYERQDPRYNNEKIQQLQRYFSDATDVGQLYLNYPMLESYFDIETLPDETYSNKKIKVDNLWDKNDKYKNIVSSRPYVGIIQLPTIIKNLLEKKVGITDAKDVDAATHELLSISDSEDMVTRISKILNDHGAMCDIQEMSHLLCAKIGCCGYVGESFNYYVYVRALLSQIILHNISKAIYIMNQNNEISPGNLNKHDFENVSHDQILNTQIIDGSTSNGNFIWILSTALFIVPDFSFDLLGDFTSDEF